MRPRRRLSRSPPFRFHERTTTSRSCSCAVTPLTSTVNVAAAAELPRLSVAVQLTVVVPIGKTDPEAFEHEGAREAPNASVAVAVYDTVAPSGEVAFTVIGPGTFSVGAPAAVTFTAKLPLLPFPWPSVALHDTVVDPIANVDPEAGEHDTGTAPSTRSLAVAV